MKLTIFSLAFFFSLIAFAQLNPDTILIKTKAMPQVLLVGTFHFAYYDEDQYKTKEENRVDILSDQRQREVMELVNYIAAFRPNKIFVEDFNRDNVLMRNYRAYRAGEYELSADEIDQIAYRLMERFELDTVYGVDARTISQDLLANDSTMSFVQSLRKEINYDTVSPMMENYFRWYELDDQVILESTLLEYFKLLNSEKYQQRGFYNLFLHSFKDPGIGGADDTTLGWISRNMRILHMITQQISSEEDRVLVLFGSSHTDFFKVFFEASTEHQLVRFEELKE